MKRVLPEGYDISGLDLKNPDILKVTDPKDSETNQKSV
jgi:hypothetical protein